MANIQEYKVALAKYISSVHEGALQGMARTYGLVLSKQDSLLVSCDDEADKANVRENFLKKKLGLTQGDAALEAVIEEVYVKIKDERMKSRLVFYCFLAEKY